MNKFKTRKIRIYISESNFTNDCLCKSRFNATYIVVIQVIKVVRFNLILSMFVFLTKYIYIYIYSSFDISIKSLCNNNNIRIKNVVFFSLKKKTNYMSRIYLKISLSSNLVGKTILY